MSQLEESYFTFPSLDEEKVWSIATSFQKEMTRLEIYIKTITPQELLNLIVSLPPSVIYLHFSFSQLNLDIIQTLIDCLSHHPSTQSFELNKYRQIDVEEMQLISKLLTLSNIEKMELTSNYIGAEETRIFSQALGKNSTLKELVFAWNSIGEEGAKALAHALKVNTALRILDCGMNGISSKGFQDIAQALTVNSTLLEIQLHWNTLGVKGAEMLAQVFKENTPLLRVFITRNKIEDEGLKYIACALHFNDTLEILDLRYNRLTKHGLEYLINTFEKNKTLQRVDIEELPNHDENFKILSKQIKQLFKRNRRILKTRRKMVAIQLFKNKKNRDIEYHILSSLIFPMAGFEAE